MANEGVEIPVIVDIDGAFQDAANRVGSAIQPLKRKVDSETLKLNIVVGVDEEGNQITQTFQEIKDTGMKNLSVVRTAVDSLTQSLIEAAAAGDKSKFGNLLEAKEYLEDMLRASQRTKLEIDGLANTMSGLSDRLQSARMALENTNIYSPDFEKVATAYKEIVEEMEIVQELLGELGTKSGSIDELSKKLASLERQWRSLGEQDLFDPSGKLTKKGQEIVDKYTTISNKIKKQNDLLREGIRAQEEQARKAKEQEAAEEAKINALIREEELMRNYRNGVIANSETMKGLNAELAEWQNALETADFHSEKWYAAANAVKTILDRIAQVNKEVRDLGMNHTSIDGLNERIRELNAQFNKMSLMQKFPKGTLGEMSVEARVLYNEYKSATEQLKKQGITLEQILQKEVRRNELREKGIQKQRYEQAILNSTVKTMRILQEQERILSEELSRKTIGSERYEYLRKKLEEVRREMQKINGEPFDKMAAGANRANRSLGSLIINAAKLYALHSAARFVQNIRAVTAEFELQKVALGSIIQDTEKAEELFRRIKATAIESPFQIKELVTYTKQLSAYQIETDKLFDTTKKLADVSAGLGVDMNRLVLAYGQVRAAAVLRGQELRQFTEAGIPLVEKLAEKFRQLGREGTTTADVFKLISERAVPFSMIEEIFDDMTSAGGIFYKMQEKQAKTLAGQWSNLKDAASIMYDEIGNTESVHRAMETLISDARNILKNWRSWANVIKTLGGAILTYIALEKLATATTSAHAKMEAAATAAESTREKGIRKLMTSIIGETAAQKISTTAMHLSSFATYKAAFATNTLSAAFWKLTMAMLNNPFGIIAVAVAGLISLFTTLANRTRDVNQEIDNANASIEALKKSRGETEKMIDSYEELRNKSNLAVDEQKKLVDISRELANLFPRASEGVDEYTGALKLNVEELRKYNEEAKKASEKAINAQIRIDEREIRRNEREINRLQDRINSGIGKFNPLVGVLGFFFQTDKQIVEMNTSINKLTDTNEKYTKSVQDMKDALAGITEEGSKTQDELTEWKKKITEFASRQKELDGTLYGLSQMTPDQIKNYSSLDDALNDVAKDYKEYNEKVTLLEKAIEGKNGAERDELALALALATARRDLTKEILDYYNAFFLTQKKTKGAAKTDPFITMMQNRIKFMQDFRKGYEGLQKMMTDTKALENESRIMLGRGEALGLSSEEQKRAVTDLSKWYTDMIEQTKKRMKSLGAKGVTVNDLLGLKISDANKQLKDLQALLQTLWDAKTDFETTQLEKNIEKQLKQISDDVKKSETARNFFNNMLDLTGDEELATNLTMSVYGQTGKDFKDRIQEELYRALTKVDGQKLNKALMDQLLGDLAIGDMEDIKNHLTELPTNIRKLFEEALEADEKFNADWLIDFEKTYAKAATYQERVSRLVSQRQREEEKARQMGKSPDEVARVTAYYDKKIAEVQLEALKDTYTWTKTFEDLDKVSSQTLDSLIKLIDEYITKYGKDLEPQQLKELTRARENAKAQKLSRNAYVSAIGAVKKYVSALRLKNQSEEKGLKEGTAYQQIMDAIADSLGRLGEAITEIESDMEQATSVAKDFMNVFASDDDASHFSEQLDNIMRSFKGVGETALGLGGVIADPTNVRAWKALVQGISDVILGIFNAAQAAKLKRLNEQIEEQEKRITALEKSYERLENAMEKAFGSDYIANYTQQIENLQAKVDAYNKQAELENQKGKKADQDKVNEYLDSAAEAQQQITDMQGQLAEFFTDTDVASAAKDFANSWIEAYKEFGSTTDAMKEKFQDLVQSMIEQSLGAKIMQTILQPLFDEIDALAAEGGELSSGEIAKIAQEAPEYIDKINAAMTTMMNQLAAAGYNVRQGVSGLTGISRDIAGASEESITGLAAGINTQNFYMSLISQNVAAILQTMTGGEVQGATGVTVPDSYKETMLQQTSFIPQIHDDMYAVRALLEKVIKPNGTSATHYVATRM
jgi:DNA repair exonuclease SbcCD ATPase subunit